jgi:chorismate mutase
MYEGPCACGHMLQKRVFLISIIKGITMRHVGRRSTKSICEMRGIRGAVQVAADTPEHIAEGTVAMLKRVVAINHLQGDELISFFFTVTTDLSSELPPIAAHEAGWCHVPMLCAAELPTQMMIPRVIRVLAHVHWRNGRQKPRHVYLPGTTPMRPNEALLNDAVGDGSSIQSSTLHRRHG